MAQCTIANWRGRSRDTMMTRLSLARSTSVLSFVRALAPDGSAAWLLFGAIIRRDAGSVAFSLTACAIAATVATFQFAVFTSFLDAGAAAPRAIGADAWITDHGVACFDFPNPLAVGYRGAIARELPDAVFERVAVGFTTWISPNGTRGNVALIGIDDSGLSPREFRADRSDLGRLQLTGGAREASIGGVTVEHGQTTGQLATFLGAPYVVLPFDTAQDILGLPSDTASYLAVRFPNGAPADLAQRLARIEAHYPEISAITGKSFAASSSSYWQNKTGAGAAILLAAVLAGLLMVILLLNGVGRFVQRRHADLISMIGHGASEAQIGGLLFLISGFMVSISVILALLLVPVFDLLSNPWLPWVVFKRGDAGFAVVIGALCMAIATISALRQMQRFSPNALFRS